MKTFWGMRLGLGRNQISHFIDLLGEIRFDREIDIYCLFGLRKKIDWVLDKNPMYCDCLDFNLYALFHRFQHSSNPFNYMFCASPLLLKDTKLISVSPVDLICFVLDKCPENCTCFNQPFNVTFNVLCPGLGYTDLPQAIPETNTPSSILLPVARRYKLDFSRNNISVLHRRAYFSMTAYIDLSSSRLKNITVEALTGLKNVATIDLHYNLLTTLPPDIKRLELSFTWLSLSGNPFDCSCSQVWFLGYLRSVQDRLLNPDGIQCYTPVRLRGRSILLIDEDEFCHDPNVTKLRNILLEIGLPVMIGVLVAGVTCIVILRKFRVTIFKYLPIHPLDRDECEGENMAYDVFVSYANEDRNFAHRVVEFLRKNSCRVCFHEEHFSFGTSIVDNINLAVVKSKRVLCIVSEHFLESDFCQEEFREAYNLNAAKRRNRLILLMLRSIESDLTSSELNDDVNLLEQFRKTHTRIDYEETTWEQHVLYAMPTRRMGREPEQLGLSASVHPQDDEQQEPLLQQLHA